LTIIRFEYSRKDEARYFTGQTSQSQEEEEEEEEENDDYDR
jgi:hypothetical protein